MEDGPENEARTGAAAVAEAVSEAGADARTGAGDGPFAQQH